MRTAATRVASRCFWAWGTVITEGCCRHNICMFNTQFKTWQLGWCLTEQVEQIQGPSHASWGLLGFRRATSPRSLQPVRCCDSVCGHRGKPQRMILLSWMCCTGCVELDVLHGMCRAGCVTRDVWSEGATTAGTGVSSPPDHLARGT